MSNKCSFITVEGIDGVGKTTLIDRLVPVLEARYHRPVTLRRMLDHPKIRALVLQDTTLSPVQRALLLRAAAIHEIAGITEARESGQIVLMDRGPDSFVAYQGYGQGLLPELKKLLMIGPAFPTPDLTLYLDMSPIQTAVRCRQRAVTMQTSLDVFEQKQVDFFMKVRKGYLKTLASRVARQERVVILDASQSKEDVFREALLALDTV